MQALVHRWDLEQSVWRKRGYETQVLEFIDMEHTPEKILLRAVKGSPAAKSRKEAEDCEDFWKIQPNIRYASGRAKGR